MPQNKDRKYQQVMDWAKRTGPARRKASEASTKALVATNLYGSADVADPQGLNHKPKR